MRSNYRHFKEGSAAPVEAGRKGGAARGPKKAESGRKGGLMSGQKRREALLKRTAQ